MWEKLKKWLWPPIIADESEENGFDEMADDTVLIIGLGNPGREYAKNRHNIGFMTADFLAERHNIRINRLEQKAMVGKGVIHGRSVVIAKPMTFMNLSGQSAGPLAKYYKISPENIVVIYDELDIELGKLRIRTKGSAGGHNGMKSLIQHLNTDEFPRIRLGIGRPPGKMAVKGYVVQDFSKNEEPFADVLIADGADAVETFIKDGIDLAMTRHNR